MKNTPLRVLFVTPEIAPYAKTGGLGDVTGALAPALQRRGIDARLLIPRYGKIAVRDEDRFGQPLGVRLGRDERWCAVYEQDHRGAKVYFLEHDVLFDRPEIYGPPKGGGGYADNPLRFALLCRAALALCRQLDWWPHVFHCHDWPGALVPIFLNTALAGSPMAAAATVLTIHNLAYQGWFPHSQASDIGLGWYPLNQVGLESRGTPNLLAGGLRHSTLVTTVSPTYAKEIQRPGQGHDLDDVLRDRRGDLFGVLNGIDDEDWNPETDHLLPARYSADDMLGKAVCKRALREEAGFSDPGDRPLLGMVTRLAQQKGINLLLEALDSILDLDVELILLGTGDPAAEQALAEAAARRPSRFAAWLTFDERLAHLIEAGSDLFLMPSLWEPCGLNQMYSQRYGTLPVVRATGGLVDTVEPFADDSDADRATGFAFEDANAEAFFAAVQIAVQLYRQQPEVFSTISRRAMALDRSWDRAAATYDYLYRLAIVRRQGR